MKMPKIPIILLIVFSAVSCLQTHYGDIDLEYQSPGITDFTSPFFGSSGNNDIIIVTLVGGSFTENITVSDFQWDNLSASISFTPFRESTNKAVICFDRDLPNQSNYRLTIKKSALSAAVSRAAIQPVKSGVWTEVSNTGFGRSPIWNISYGNGLFLAACENGRIGFSDDGIIWDVIQGGFGPKFSQFGTDNTVRGIAHGDNRYFAVGYSARMANSTNGKTWDNGWDENYFGGRGGSSILAITYGAGRFLAAGADGKMICIWDGDWWDTVNCNFDGKNVLSLCYGNPNNTATFVAGGTDGKMTATINNENNWYPVNDSYFINNEEVNGIAYGNGLFVAGGSSGKIIWSNNGWDWNEAANKVFINDESQYVGIKSVAFGLGMFIAVGHNGNMAVSKNGNNWTSMETVFANNEQIRAVAYGNGRFVAAGDPYTAGEFTRIIYSFQNPLR